MTKMMKAAMMVAKSKIEIGEKPVPTYKDDEVLVRIKHVGICGADQEFYHNGAIGGWILEYPHTLGHEPAGIVEGVGINVKDLKVGDAVCIEPGKPCWNCDFCRKGLYNLCPDVVFMSVPGVTGAFQEYVAWPANLVYKLPENVDTMAGCLVEPLAVGFHSVFQSGAKIGDTAVILGCGCIGICCLMGLRAIGVHDVYMVDLSQVRLEKAMQCGAKAVYNGKDVDIAQKIMELTNGRGADVVFECTGVASQGDKAIECICKGGMVQFVGLHATNVVPINLNGLIFKEGKVNTTFRYRHVYPIVIKAIAAGIAPIKDIVSHTFKFEELDHAIDFNINNKDAVTKIVIEL